MCQIQYSDSIACSKCDKTIDHLKSQYVTCRESEQSGVVCRRETCMKVYTEGSKLRHFVRSWMDCPDCSVAPENNVAALPLENEQPDGRQTTVDGEWVTENFAFKPVWRSNVSRRKPLEQLKDAQRKQKAQEDLEIVVKNSRFESARKASEGGGTESSDDVAMG